MPVATRALVTLIRQLPHYYGQMEDSPAGRAEDFVRLEDLENLLALATDVAGRQRGLSAADRSNSR